MDTVIESEIRRKMSRYRVRRYLGFAAYILVLIHLVFVPSLTDHMMYPLSRAVGNYTALVLFFSFLLMHVIGIILALMVAGSASLDISYILSKECDPFLYEACLVKTTRFSIKKDSVLCNRALAQYYQGNFPLAWSTLQQIDRNKLRGLFKYNYYLIMSALCFRQNMGDRVPELEEEFRRRIQNKKDQKHMKLLYVNNNLSRATANKDLTAAFRFIQEFLNLSESLNTTWTKIQLSFEEANLDIAAGHMEAARPKLEFVAAKGNRLFCAQEARRLLAEDEQSQ